MFLTWLDLLPQMQAFEHRLFEKKDCDTAFVTVPFFRIIIVPCHLHDHKYIIPMN